MLKCLFKLRLNLSPSMEIYSGERETWGRFMEKERCRGERRCKKDTLHGLRWRGAVRRKIMEKRIIDTWSKQDVETYTVEY